VLSALCLACGCGGDDGPAPPGGDADTDVDADTDADTDTGTGTGTDSGTGEDCARVWEFRSGEATIAAGEQEYRCTTHDVPAGMGGQAVRISMAVPEEDESIVHHLVLMRGDSPGLAGCTAAEIFNPIVFAGGLGTDPLVLPAGVGLPVAEGGSFLMQLHVTNATDEAVTYDVGADLCIVDATESDADVITFGPTSFTIPDDGAEHTVYDDTCAIDGTRTFFAAYPHMHRLGRRIELGIDGEVWAAVPEWDFSDQPTVHPDPPVVGTDGQALTVSCTWVNPPGNGEVRWGTETEDEMCFGFAYYHPSGLDRWCADIPGF
jgi:hypothetical protein